MRSGVGRDCCPGHRVRVGVSSSDALHSNPNQNHGNPAILVPLLPTKLVP